MAVGAIQVQRDLVQRDAGVSQGTKPNAVAHQTVDGALAAAKEIETVDRGSISSEELRAHWNGSQSIWEDNTFNLMRSPVKFTDAVNHIHAVDTQALGGPAPAVISEAKMRHLVLRVQQAEGEVDHELSKSEF